MSSITYSVERLLNFEGGVPVRRDLAPSILFTILLALTFPILAWRFVTAAHRSYVLGSSFMFFLTRFIALIMRAYMSRNSYNIHLVLAQSVLMTIGWLFLINALVDLMRKNVLRQGVSHATHANGTAVNTRTKSSGWITYFAHFHRLLLLASFATIVAGAAILGRRYRGIDELNNVRNLVRASYLLGLITLVVALLTTIATHFSHARSPTKSGLIIGMGVFLLVSSIYRVVATFRGYGPTNRGLAAFWVALILMEFIAYLITLAVSIPKWYHNHHDRTTRFGSDAEKLAHPAHPNTTTSHTGPAGVHTHTGTNATVPGTTGHTTTTTTTH